jgi:hypothetical protein
VGWFENHPKFFWGGVGWFSRKPKNPEVVPGWGCWGGFKKTKISKINVYFIKKKRRKLCIYSRPRNGFASSTSFKKRRHLKLQR